jgi:Fe-S-cluster containining protein
MPSDHTLIQIIDAALAEAARLSGPWLLCRPGCAQCCLGEFPITQLDAARLRRGLGELETRDPERAARVSQRTADAVASHAPMADDDPCPALDPETGTCDLYAARPITCRTFGPPVRCESGDLGVCELCFDGASDAEISACEVDFDPQGLEPVLLRELEARTGVRGETTVAAALSAMSSSEERVQGNPRGPGGPPH